MSTEQREASILSLALLVERIASKMARRVPSFVDKRDLVSAGWLGAIHAVDYFRAGPGVELGRFASKRIRGAILDYLRGEDALTREHRKAIRAGECLPPACFSIDRKLTWAPKCELVDRHAQKEMERVESQRTIVTLFRRSADISRRNKKIVLLYYFGGLTMLQLARRFGVCKTRLSQIIQRATERLRAA